MEKDNIIEKNLDDKLKYNIQNCQIHYKIFCAWSEEELRNICFLDVGELLVKKKIIYYMET